MLDYLRIVSHSRLARAERRDAPAAEYGLLVAGIAALLVAVVVVFGDSVAGVF